MPDPTRAVPGGLSPFQCRCPECKSWFRPCPRLKLRQKTCGSSACRLKHRARYQRRYRRQNPKAEEECRAKIKERRGPGFWKQYRSSHPQETERNRLQTKLRNQLLRAGLQRKLDIVQVFNPPGYFDLFQGFATSHRSLVEASQAKYAA